MKKHIFTVMGTGAGCGIPAFFCDCPACQEARENPAIRRGDCGVMVRGAGAPSVSDKLRAQLGLAASDTFPAGTLSGAPKVRAMEILSELEKSPRGLYGGVAGFFSYTGEMNFAIVIRTMFLEKGVLTMRAGAGIVADSDPKKEYQETINKSKAIFAAARFAAEIG